MSPRAFKLALGFKDVRLALQAAGGGAGSPALCQRAARPLSGSDRRRQGRPRLGGARQDLCPSCGVERLDVAGSLRMRDKVRDIVRLPALPPPDPTETDPLRARRAREHRFLGCAHRHLWCSQQRRVSRSHTGPGDAADGAVSESGACGSGAWWGTGRSCRWSAECWQVWCCISPGAHSPHRMPSTTWKRCSWATVGSGWGQRSPTRSLRC